MREYEKNVYDLDLANEWFKEALFSIDNLKDVIEFNNYRYGFNLYDNDEDLDEEVLRCKIAIKYKNICLPLMSAIEEALKALLIKTVYSSESKDFKRDEIVFNLVKDVRKEENKNGHDIFALMNYITNHYYSDFIICIADEYAFIRDHNSFYNNVFSPRSTFDFNTSEERIKAATKEYTQGFIEFRYLYEKDSKHSKNVDLTKIIQYAEAILEVVKQRIYKDSALFSMEDFFRAIPKNNFTKDFFDNKMEIEKKQRLKKIYQKGFLPVNNEYCFSDIWIMDDNYESIPVFQALQDFTKLENNPKKFIIEECILACQELWDKNIFIDGTSNYDSDESGCWIDIKEAALSEENRKIIGQLLGCERIELYKDEYIFRLKSNSVGLKGKEDLLNLAQQLINQDVQENFSYISVRKFLIDYCECYDEIPNPNYTEIDWDKIMNNFQIDENTDIDLKSLFHNNFRYLKQFNPSKITKPIEELVAEQNMILDGERVYLSSYYYQKHLNYVNKTKSNLNVSKK